MAHSFDVCDATDTRDRLLAGRHYSGKNTAARTIVKCIAKLILPLLKLNFFALGVLNGKNSSESKAGKVRKQF